MSELWTASGRNLCFITITLGVIMKCYIASKCEDVSFHQFLQQLLKKCIKAKLTRMRLYARRNGLGLLPRWRGSRYTPHPEGMVGT
jgi:hypothetical protein